MIKSLKNNKGITIIEIVISVTLIAIVMVFLFGVLITVRGEDEKSKALSTLLMNQALLIKEIEMDFIEYGLIGIESCKDGATRSDDSVNSVIPFSSSLRSTPAAGTCIKLIYNPAKLVDNVGYLLYYSYDYSSSEKIHVIGYRRGEKRTLRETALPWSENTIISKNCYPNDISPSSCVISIDVPVLNTDGEDYGIHLSYLYNDLQSFSYPVSDSHYHFEIKN